jgi:hypothetical protein
MESWMLVAGAGGALGLVALGGMVWAFRKLAGGRKWGALGGFAVLGAVGGFLAANATALVTTEEEAAIEQQVQESNDFDAPLSDDF